MLLVCGQIIAFYVFLCDSCHSYAFIPSINRLKMLQFCNMNINNKLYAYITFTGLQLIFVCDHSDKIPELWFLLKYPGSDFLEVQ